LFPSSSRLQGIRCFLFFFFFSLPLQVPLVPFSRGCGFKRSNLFCQRPSVHAKLDLPKSEKSSVSAGSGSMVPSSISIRSLFRRCPLFAPDDDDCLDLVLIPSDPSMSYRSSAVFPTFFRTRLLDSHDSMRAFFFLPLEFSSLRLSLLYLRTGSCAAPRSTPPNPNFPFDEF